jgi:hypothetical protein
VFLTETRLYIRYVVASLKTYNEGDRTFYDANITTLCLVEAAAQPEAGRAVFQAIKPSVKLWKRFNCKHITYVSDRLEGIKKFEK